MKRNSSQAFTLVEMLTVMLIISILTGLIVAVATLANKNAAKTKTQGEIEALSTAIANYKADNGAVPRQEQITEQAPTTGTTSTPPPIDPRSDGDPTLPKYLTASQFLYQQLSGDANLDGTPGDNQTKIYMEFKPSMLGGITPQQITAGGGTVAYLQDPYGFSYGYSTAGAANEDLYRKNAAKATQTSGANGDITTQAPDRSAQTPYGYNVTFDLWSTAGTRIDPPTEVSRQKWIKNW